MTIYNNDEFTSVVVPAQAVIVLMSAVIALGQESVVEPQTGAPIGYSSEIALTRQFTRLEAKRSAIEAEIEALSEALGSVRDAKKKLAELNIRKLSDEVKDSAEELKAILEPINALKDDDVLQQARASELRDSLETFLRVSSYYFSDGFPRYSFSYVGPATISTDSMRAQQLAQSIVDSVSFPNIWPDDSVRSAANRLRYDILSTVESQVQAKEVKPYVSDLLKGIQTAAAGGNQSSQIVENDKKAISDYFNKLTGALQQAQRERSDSLSNLSDTMSAIDKKLITTQKSTADINQSLVYTVYMVIGALILLFFLLKFLPHDISTMLITSRTLFETVSLAFLMVTIIILGIGDRIQTQTLGTLLGTVAGYIFGRQLAQRPATESTDTTIKNFGAAPVKTDEGRDAGT